MTHRAFAVWLVLVATSMTVTAAVETGRPPEKPADIGLVEKAAARLAQIDVTVSGKPDALSALAPRDFELWLDLDKVEDLVVDRICQSPPAAEAPAGEAEPTAPPEPGGPIPAGITLKQRPATYLFYLDAMHLTMTGWNRALEMMHELIPKLITGENRGMIVVSARELTTEVRLTPFPRALLDAVGRLEKDRMKWDPYAELEDSRVAEVIQKLNEPRGGVNRAMALARFYQGEDRFRMEKAMRRLSMVLGRFADVDSPKALFYFSDTLRGDAGGHYVKIFGKDVRGTGVEKEIMTQDSKSGELSLDRIINEASASGIRFYPIQAQGLVSASISASTSLTGSYQADNSRIPSSVRTHDAQDTLSAMALETGGQAFLNGVGVPRIVDRISQDLGCFYLLSFDPTGFREDKPIAIRVKVNKPGVTVHARGRLVIPSETSRLTARLLSAFAAPEVMAENPAIQAELVPLGFKDGQYAALVQVAVPGSRTPGSTWDLGASLVARDKVREDFSGHVSVKTPGAPIVLEQEMTFSPGPYEIIVVARETSIDEIASRQIEGSWPDPEISLATIGPIAVIQPTLGAFVRNGVAHTTGSLSHSESNPLRTDVPTALVGIVCRSRDQKGAIRAERKLIGETAVAFPPMDLDLGSDRCAQVRDLIKANTLGPGEFRYEIRVLKGEQELARGERTFVALTPEPPKVAETEPAPAR